jgi:hypothetical protein
MRGLVRDEILQEDRKTGSPDQEGVLALQGLSEANPQNQKPFLIFLSRTKIRNQLRDSLTCGGRRMPPRPDIRLTPTYNSDPSNRHVDWSKARPSDS